MANPITILIDADACPVKDEIYRVADRFKAQVRVVSNSPFRVPDNPRVKRVVTDGYTVHISGGGQPSASATARPSLSEEPRGADAPRPAHEGPKFDAADDWIAQEAEALPPGKCVVITGDIPLADRCLKSGARVLKHNGDEFTAASIGSALATRAIMEDLRAGMAADLNGATGGPPPFGKADRSRFLQALDRVMVAMARC